MRFPNHMIQRYISEMISHLFTNYQTTYSTHIPNPFIIDGKLLYTMIQNYGQHLSHIHWMVIMFMLVINNTKYYYQKHHFVIMVYTY